MKVSQEPKYDAICDGDETHLQNRQSGELIPEDEPVFIFRARDVHALTALKAYMRAIKHGDPHHLAAVTMRGVAFAEFKDKHPKRMKKPDTDLS